VGHHAARGARVGAAPAAARGAHFVDGSDLRGERVDEPRAARGRRLPRLVARVLRGLRHLQLHALPPQLPPAPAEPSRDGAQGQDTGESHLFGHLIRTDFILANYVLSDQLFLLTHMFRNIKV
jgi:hypothetical protein